MATTLKEKKKILDFIANFSGIAKEGKWTSHYDTDNDSLAVRTPKLSEDSRKKYFNDEFAFYINKKNEVEGIFIEYFASNFVAHHKKDFQGILKEMRKDIKNIRKKEKSVLALKQKEIRKIIPELESVIINSLIPRNELLGKK